VRTAGNGGWGGAGPGRPGPGGCGGGAHRRADRYRDLRAGQQLGEAFRGAQRPGLQHRAVGEHHHAVAAADRGEPVGDDDADPVAQQPVGGPLHVPLGHRIHPGGGLVQNDHLRVTDQDPGERHQLLLAGGEHVPAVAEPGVQAVRQLRHPGGQPQLVQCPAGRLQQARVEEGDVLGEGTGEDLGALRHDRHPPPQLLQVQVQQVAPGQPDRSGGDVHRPGEHLGQRRLARAGTPHHRVGVAGPERQGDPDQGRPPRLVAGAGGVGEGQVAQLQVAGGGRGPAHRLLPGGPQQGDPAPGAQRVLQLRDHPADVVDGEGEREHQQPHRGQPGPHHPGGDGRDARRPGPHQPAPGQYLGGPPGVETHHVGAGQAGTDVVLAVDGLLHRRRQVRPGLLLGDPDRPDLPDPPGQPGDQQRGDHHHADAGRPPDHRGRDDGEHPDGQPLGDAYAAAAHLRGHLVHVAVNPVEQFPDRCGLQRGQLLAEGHPAQPSPQVGRPVGGEPGGHQPDRQVAQRGHQQPQRQQQEQRPGAVHQHRPGQRRGGRLSAGAEHDEGRHQRGTPRRGGPQVAEQAHGTPRIAGG
jgi:hypothetical protein